MGDLEPSENGQQELGFRVTWPKGFNLSFLKNPWLAWVLGPLLGMNLGGGGANFIHSRSGASKMDRVAAGQDTIRQELEAYVKSDVAAHSDLSRRLDEDEKKIAQRPHYGPHRAFVTPPLVDHIAQN